MAFGFTGIPLALTTPNGDLTRYGILVPAVGWLVCAALGWGEPADGARRVLGAVRSYRDLETPLIGAVEQLIDFVTALADTDSATR